MTVACVAEELQRQQRPHGTGGRDHLRSGETRAARGSGRGGWRSSMGRNRNRPPNLGAEARGAAGRVGGRRPHRPTTGRVLVGPLVVGAARQLGEALVLEDRGDGRRAERLAVAGQGAADVVDGEVLLAQGDDVFPEGFGLGCGVRSLGRGQEEVAAGILAELMDEDAEAARGVAEAAAASAEGRPSTKKARRASYCRWVELEGSRKTRARSVSFLASLVNIVPKCHIGAILGLQGRLAEARALALGLFEREPVPAERLKLLAPPGPARRRPARALVDREQVRACCANPCRRPPHGRGLRPCPGHRQPLRRRPDDAPPSRGAAPRFPARLGRTPRGPGARLAT